MKKWLIRIVLAVVVLVVLAVVFTALFIGSVVKKGVETAGPMIAKVDVKLDSADVSFVSGSAHLHGLVVGNPQGYKTDSAIRVGDVSVALKPMSVLSSKIVVKSVHVQAPEITVEGGIKNNNLTQIQANVGSAAGQGGGGPGGASGSSGGGGKKFEVDDLSITGAKLHFNNTMLGGKTVTMDLPDIHLTDMGTGPDGITPAELTKRVMSALMGSVTTALGNAGKDVENVGKEGVNKLKGLFKK